MVPVVAASSALHGNIELRPEAVAQPGILVRSQNLRHDVQHAEDHPVGGDNSFQQLHLAAGVQMFDIAQLSPIFTCPGRKT